MCDTLLPCCRYGSSRFSVFTSSRCHHEWYRMLVRASGVDPSMFGTRQFQWSLSNRVHAYTDPTSFVFHTVYQTFLLANFYVIPILVCNNSNNWSQTLIKKIDQYVWILYCSPINLQLFHQSRKKIKVHSFSSGKEKIFEYLSSRDHIHILPYMQGRRSHVRCYKCGGPTTSKYSLHMKAPRRLLVCGLSMRNET